MVSVCVCVCVEDRVEVSVLHESGWVRVTGLQDEYHAAAAPQTVVSCSVYFGRRLRRRRRRRQRRVGGISGGVGGGVEEGHWEVRI